MINDSYYRQVSTNNSLIIDSKSSDINGDKKTDNIYLVGTKEPDGLVTSNIRVDIKNGDTFNIDLKVNKGYNPRLFIGDFTKDGIDDILVSIESGNTGQEGYFYIYSFLNNTAVKVFDFEEFNSKYQYDVTYQDNYIVVVSAKFSNQKFTISIRGREYASGLYEKSGKLIKPLKGMVSKIMELRPIDGNNGYNIETVQRVVGYFNADTLGMIMTSLKYNGKQYDVTNIDFRPV
jgi:hypothetical protein